MAQNKQTQTGNAPTATQILQSSWATSVDSQTAQQFTGLAQVRQSRANQLQREATSLTKEYGANDPGVLAVQASLKSEQTFASRLGVVSTTTSTATPTAPANGWVIYGRVRNADLTPAPQLTVFLADECRAWLRKYAYAFTDQTGYFTLSYAPPAAGKKGREDEAHEESLSAYVDTAGKKARHGETRQDEARAPESLSAYVEVSNAACKLMYIDASPMPIAAGAVVYRDIVLSAEVPLGTPPCEPGAPPSAPPATKTK